MTPALWNIRDEWSPLEVVMVGIGKGMGPAPSADETYDPKSLEHVLAGTYPSEASVTAELDGLAALLERYGAKVLRPVSLGTNQVFTRDIGLVIGEQFVLTHLVEERRPEQAGLRDVLNLCSIPAISVPDEVRIEGGDVLLIDGELWVGYSEEPDFAFYKTARTNSLALEWLAMTFPTLRVRGFALKKSDTNAREGALHLDCCLFVASRGHAVFHPGGLKSAEDVLWIRKRFDGKLLEIDAQEMFDMHCNLISINPDTLVIGEGFERVRNQLTTWGYRVEEVPFRETAKMGGLLRCTTLPLRRSPSL